jgi:hypothetical protein
MVGGRDGSLGCDTNCMRRLNTYPLFCIQMGIIKNVFKKCHLDFLINTIFK